MTTLSRLITADGKPRSQSGRQCHWLLLVWLADRTLSRHATVPLGGSSQSNGSVIPVFTHRANTASCK